MRLFIGRLPLISALLILLISTSTFCQTVTVSQEISIRNNFSYHVIGRVNETLLLYQNKGNDRNILLFDEDLVKTSERQINLEKKRAQVYDLLNIDTAFCLFYGYTDKDGMTTRMNIYSETAELIDSVQITLEEASWKGLDYEIVFSDDKSKAALYSIKSDENIRLIVYDIFNREVMMDQEYVFKKVDLEDDFEQVILTNDGKFILLLEVNNNRNSRESHHLSIFSFYQGNTGADEIYMPLNDVVSPSVMMAYDNTTQTLGIAGLYNDKRKSEAEGYFWVASKMDAFDNKEIVLSPFGEDVLFEVYGDRKKKKLEDFDIVDIFWKADQSPLLTFEMTVDLSRRSAGVAPYSDGVTNYGSLSGWSDHYREDIVITSLDRNGDKLWHQVFYKKQFSQNDGGAFSSYFPFESPSRMRLLFNDEIKNNSTVSEYIFDGAGNYKRTSVLSTEYQNLKLRFRDALQLSSTELLVPSQRNYALSLVKIDFMR